MTTDSAYARRVLFGGLIGSMSLVLGGTWSLHDVLSAEKINATAISMSAFSMIAALVVIVLSVGYAIVSSIYDTLEEEEEPEDTKH